MQKKWLRRLGWAAVILSVALSGYILYHSAAQLRDVEWKNLLLPALLGLGIYGISLITQALVWAHLVASLTGQSWGWWDIKIYCATHLTRRLPGAPWYWAGRALAYREQERGSQAALTASILEWGGTLIAAGGWIVVERWGVLGLLGTLSLLGIITLAWPWLTKRQWRRPLLLTKLSAKWVIFLYLFYTLAWLFGSTILYLLMHAMAPDTSTTIFKTTALWALGGGISMLMVLAPAGLGIREITLTALLQPHIGIGLSMVTSILLRLLFTSGDLVWGGLFWYLANASEPLKSKILHK